MSDTQLATTSSGGGLSALLEKGKEQMAKALPRHLTPDRMIRLAVTAYNKTPDLQKCDLMSIASCVMSASQLGLEIDGVLGHAYLVPFYNKKKKRSECQLIVGYKGFIALATRSGKIHQFGAHVVHERDEFDMEYGSRQFIHHKPSLRERGDPLGVYAMAHPLAGPVDFEWLPWSEVLKCQEKYAKRGDDGRMWGTWVDHLPEMARKTPIRLMAKRLPLSPEFQRAAAFDDYADQGLEQTHEAALPFSQSDALAARLSSRSTAPLATAEQRERIAQLCKQGEKTDDGITDLLALVGCSDPATLTSSQAEEVILHLTEAQEGSA